MDVERQLESRQHLHVNDGAALVRLGVAYAGAFEAKLIAQLVAATRTSIRCYEIKVVAS
jgi:hypothetical protein